MTDAEFIKARVHEAVKNIRPTVVRLAQPLMFAKCRWCGKQLVASATWQWWVRVGFCSRACVVENYDERGD